MNLDNLDIWARMLLANGIINPCEAQVFLMTHGNRGFYLNLNRMKKQYMKYIDMGLRDVHNVQGQQEPKTFKSCKLKLIKAVIK